MYEPRVDSVRTGPNGEPPSWPEAGQLRLGGPGWLDGPVVHQHGGVSVVLEPDGSTRWWRGPAAPACQIDEPVAVHNTPPSWKELGVHVSGPVVPVALWARLEGLPEHLAQLLRVLSSTEDGDKRRTELEALAARLDRLEARPGDGVDLAVAEAEAIALVAELAAGHVGHELGVMAADASINRRGVPIDTDLARALYEIESRVRYDLLTHPNVEAVDVRRRDDLDRLVASLREADDVPHSQIEDILLARDATNRNTRSKLGAILADLGDDDRVRHAFRYAGGRTGRWVSRTFHSLTKGSQIDHEEAIAAVHRKDLARLEQIARDAGVPVHEVLASLIRKTIQPPGGRLLVIADFSSIEVRVLLLLAGDDIGLNAIRNGQDPYRHLASELFRVSVAKVTAAQRSFAKPVFLGCMFGMSARTLEAYVAHFGLTWADFGLQPEGVVEHWREVHPLIASAHGLWEALEDAAWEVIRNGADWSVGGLTFTREARDLLVELPSGRRVRYRNAEFVRERGRDQLVYRHRRQRVRLWGSKLAENLTQAVARDVLATKLCELEERGLEVVMHIHDEVVVEARAESAALPVKQILESPPTWAPDLPLEAKVRVAQRYGK